MSCAEEKYNIGFIYNEPQYTYFNDDIKYKINCVCFEVMTLREVIESESASYEKTKIDKCRSKVDFLYSQLLQLYNEIEILIAQGNDSS